MKITKTLYIQAVKHSFENEFNVQINSFRMGSDNYCVVIDIAEHELELDIPDIDSNELTLAHIEQLNEMKLRMMADNNLRLEKIDNEIQKLMALEAVG